MSFESSQQQSYLDDTELAVVGELISGEDFKAEILRWRMKDIFNEPLLSHRLNAIPPTFGTSLAWRSSFPTHYLEEMRAQLKAKLVKDFDTWPRCRAKVVRRRGHGQVYLVLETAATQPAFESSCLCSFGLLAISGKGGLLKTDVHAQSRVQHVLVQITFLAQRRDPVWENHPGCNVILDATIPTYFEETYAAEMLSADEFSVEFLALGAGWMSGYRACCALFQDNHAPGIMSDVVSGRANSSTSERGGKTPLLAGPHGDADTDISRLTSGLNESQLATIDRVMAVGSPGTPPIQLIKGPFGTGKTKTLVTLLRSLLECGLSVYAGAPTNVAVVELARRTVEACQVPPEPSGGGGVRLASHHPRLATILLVGDPSRLKLDADSDVSRIWITDRVNRLREAVGSYSIRSNELLKFISSRGHTLPQFPLEIVELSAFDCLQRMVADLKNHLFTLASEAPDEVLRLDDSVSFLIQNLEEAASMTCADLSQWMLTQGAEESVLDNLPPVLHAVSVNCNLLINSELVIRAASLVFSTVNVAGREMMRTAEFDVAVVDEATQMVQAEIAIVLQPRLRCLVLAGDDKQLPATVISNKSKALEFDVSLFSRLAKLDYPMALLNTQYRVHPNISSWPRRRFYNGAVSDGPNVLSEDYIKPWHDKIPPYSVCDVSFGHEETDERGSFYNEAEGLVVRHLVKRLRNLKIPLSVSIITPYRAMVDNLADLSGSTPGGLSIKVSTIDGFQGQESDVTIFVTVRSNGEGNVGFLSDERRLNVGVTRARFAHCTVCSTRTLRSDPTWHNMLEHATSNNCMHFLDDLGVVGKLLTNAAKEHADPYERMNALKKMDDLLKTAPWVVTYSQDFLKSFGEDNELVIKALLNLAHGEWPKHEFVSCRVSEALRPVVHMYKIKHRWLVWSVDLLINCTRSEQCIKIWNVVSESRLDRIIRQVEGVLNSYLPERLERCCSKTQEPNSGRKLASSRQTVPQIWASDSEIESNATAAPLASTSSCVENTPDDILEPDCNDVSESAVRQKFYTLTSDVARVLLWSTDLQLQNIELPFDMSPTEEEIVRYPGSVFILGRSGTGKTTVILHRMFLLDQYNRRRAEPSTAAGEEGTTDDVNRDVDDPSVSISRQLLVTASPVLCDAISQSYNSMVNSAAKVEQVGKIEAPGLCAKTVDNCEPSVATRNTVTSSELNSFANSEPKDFPMIVTYMKFLRLLDATLDTPFFGGGIPSCSLEERREVDLVRFANSYYPFFSTEAKKIGDAALYFTEIMSHIKGSILSLAPGCRGRLSLEQYLALADGRGSNLDATQREVIYKMFLKYKSMKDSDHPLDYDIADAVYHVYSALASSGYRGPMMNTVSVDEVQDLLPAQIALFKFVCTDVRGFVFAGDTAQTIAGGVGFRFETLNDIFYSEFLGSPNPNPNEASKNSLMPKLWKLSENFRTHVGIVNIANSVVELLCKFFPNSIDRLDPERSSIASPRPIFTNGTENALEALFGTSGSNACEFLEFGAFQVILVRDDATKKDVMKVCADRATVLTVLEAKGIEFDDCLLYNYFSSGNTKEQWRVLYEAFSPDTPHPKFDVHKHSVLCAELKFLYVLITRTRQRLIICDDDTDRRKVMLEYWKHFDLVEVKSLDEDVKRMFETVNTPEEWRASGRQLFDRKLYADAQRSFQRAGDDLKAEECMARALEQEADKEQAVAPVKAHGLYKKAAKIFEKIDHAFEAGRCFESAKEYAAAALQYSKTSRFKDAARCYEQLKMWSEAAKHHYQVPDVAATLRCWYLVPDYDRALLDLENIDDVNSNDRDKFVQECVKKGALFYHGAKNTLKMMEFVYRFDTEQAKKSFLVRWKHDEFLLEVLLRDGNLKEAAQLYEIKYDFVNAAKCFSDTGLGVESARVRVRDVRARLLGDNYLPQPVSPCSVDGKTVHEQLQVFVAAGCKKSELGGILMLKDSAADWKDSLKAIDEEADEDFDSLWHIKWDALRLLSSQLDNSTDGISAKSSQELMEACTERHRTACILHDIARKVAPALIVPPNTPLSASHKRVLDQCLLHFEFDAPPTKTPNVVCNPVLKGAEKVFGSHKLSLTEFGQRASKFIHDEVSDELHRSYTSCENVLRKFPAKIYSEWRDNFMLARSKRPPLELRTEERFRALSIMSDCLHRDRNAKVLGGLQAIRRQQFGILLPDEPELVDISAVAKLRRDSVESSGVIKAILQRDFAKPRLNSDMYTRTLLAAELADNVGPTCFRLQSVLASESCRSKDKNEGVIIEERIRVVCMGVEAFVGESSSATADKDAEGKLPLGMFYYSLQLGVNFLLKTTAPLGLYIDEARRKLPKKGDKNRSTQASDPLGLLSPSAFTQMFRKYFVLLILEMKSFTGAVFPSVLAEDVLLRKNSAYVRVILEYSSYGGDHSDLSKAVMSDRAGGSKSLLYELVMALLTFLKLLTKPRFDAWCECCKVRSDSNKDRFRGPRDSFVQQVVHLLLVYAINCPVTDRIRDIICTQINKIVRASEGASALSSAPYFFSILMCSKLTASRLEEVYSEYLHYTEDRLIFIHARSSSTIPAIPERFRGLRALAPKLMNLVGDSPTVGSVDLLPYVAPKDESSSCVDETEADVVATKAAAALPTTDAALQAPAASEDPLEKFAPQLAALLEAARKWLKGLSALEKLQRYVTREFARAGLFQPSDGLREYAETICPLHMKLAEVRDHFAKYLEGAEGSLNLEERNDMMDCMEDVQNCMNDMMGGLSARLGGVQDMRPHIDELAGRGTQVLEAGDSVLTRVCGVSTPTDIKPPSARAAPVAAVIQKSDSASKKQKKKGRK